MNNPLCKFRSNEDSKKAQPFVYVSALYVQGIEESSISFEDPKSGRYIKGTTLWVANKSIEIQESVEQAYKIFEEALK